MSDKFYCGGPEFALLGNLYAPRNIFRAPGLICAASTISPGAIEISLLQQMRSCFMCGDYGLLFGQTALPSMLSQDTKPCASKPFCLQSAQKPDRQPFVFMPIHTDGFPHS